VSPSIGGIIGASGSLLIGGADGSSFLAEAIGSGTEAEGSCLSSLCGLDLITWDGTSGWLGLSSSAGPVVESASAAVTVGLDRVEPG
jgi:hypothetical protein